MGKPKLPPGFVYDRPVPKRWAEELATLAPPNEIKPWLLLVWLPGDPWGPVQRWCVYEMVPLRLWWSVIQGHRQRGKSDSDIIELDILAALNGPNPRELGYYDTVLDRFVTEAECTRQEWELHRQHKCIPLLFWIIQGDKGGHKRTFTPLEQKYLGQAGLPTDPPNPGDLPYADFDQRVLHQLVRRDRLRSMEGHVSESESERSQQYVEFRRHLVAYLTEQQTAMLEEAKLDLSGIPTSSAKEDDPTGMIEQAVDNFIRTGQMHPPEES